MRMVYICILVLCLLALLYVGSVFVPVLCYKQGYDKQSIEGKVIVGHRGGAGIGAENSLSCFKKGIASGADMIETDIHQTRDGVLVVSHDPTVDRMTNGEGSISEMTYSDIAKLRIVDQNGNVTNEQIPTFEETLDLFAEARKAGRNVKLLVEIKLPHKDAYKGIEKRMLDIIQEKKAENWVVVQSFSDQVIEKVYALNPNIRIEKLFFFKFPGLPFIADLSGITKFDYERYHYVSSFNVFYRATNKQFIEDVHRHGKEVKIWTLDSIDAPVLDVDGIITDRPDLWR